MNWRLSFWRPHEGNIVRSFEAEKVGRRRGTKVSCYSMIASWEPLPLQWFCFSFIRFSLCSCGAGEQNRSINQKIYLFSFCWALKVATNVSLLLYCISVPLTVSMRLSAGRILISISWGPVGSVLGRVHCAWHSPLSELNLKQGPEERYFRSISGGGCVDLQKCPTYGK